MPNWCFTSITITGPSVKETKNFYNLIIDWTSKNYCPNDFGNNWLGNIVGNSGIGNIEDEKYECRGTLEYLDYDGSKTINLDTQTAWAPMIKMWVALINKYLPGGKLIYTAEECSCDVYLTNDPEYAEKYYYDSWGETGSLTNAEKERYEKCEAAHESCEKLSFEELKEIINTLIPQSVGLETEEELLKKWEDSNFRNLAIFHKWEFEAVDAS